jgi:ribonuclease HII
MLANSYPNFAEIQIGVDEAGRGPLFGRVYVGAVCLPEDLTATIPWKKTMLGWAQVKDSKKISNPIKRQVLADFICNHAKAWAIDFAEVEEIAEYNILHATQRAMHRAITQVIEQLPVSTSTIGVLVDGNYFTPYHGPNGLATDILSNGLATDILSNGLATDITHQCIEGGDNLYLSIASASILAKTARDAWVLEQVVAHPEWEEHYGLSHNKGYGTKLHREGIQQYGTCSQHRMGFRGCASEKKS